MYCKLTAWPVPFTSWYTKTFLLHIYLCMSCLHKDCKMLTNHEHNWKKGEWKELLLQERGIGSFAQRAWGKLVDVVGVINIPPVSHWADRELCSLQTITLKATTSIKQINNKMIRLLAQSLVSPLKAWMSGMLELKFFSYNWSYNWDHLTQQKKLQSNQ